MRLGVFGPQGSGKSFIVSMLSRHLMELDKDLMLYTNMNLQGDNIKTIVDLSEFPFNDGKNKIFILDEAYFTLNSRNSSSKNNQIWTSAFALFRKSDTVLSVFITHRPRMIDVNFREQLDYIMMCRKNPTHFDYLLMDTVSELTTSITIPKVKEVFDYAKFDTKDFPLPIKVEGLKDNPLFQILK